MKLKFRQIRTRLKRNERMLSSQAFKRGEESGSRQNNTLETITIFIPLISITPLKDKRMMFLGVHYL